jgi:HSP20 family protein
VQVEDDNLVIEAERKRPEWPKDSAIHVSERSYGTMRRAFTMPEDASAEGIKATYRDGVLEVTVAKKPQAKPTKIKVEVEN